MSKSQFLYVNPPGDMSGSSEESHATSGLSLPELSWRCVGDSPTVEAFTIVEAIDVAEAIEVIAQQVVGPDEWVASG